MSSEPTAKSKQITIVIIDNNNDTELSSFFEGEYAVDIVPNSKEDYTSVLETNNNTGLIFYAINNEIESENIKELEDFFNAVRQSNSKIQIIGYGKAINYKQAIQFMKCGGRTIIELPSFKAELLFEVEKSIQDYKSEASHNDSQILENRVIKNNLIQDCYKKIKRCQAQHQDLQNEELKDLLNKRDKKDKRDKESNDKKKIKMALDKLNHLIHHKENSIQEQQLLIVEDDDHIRNIYKTCFEKHCKVNTVESGEDALDFLKTNSTVSVVILDIGLDKITGDRMVKSIKDMDPLCDIVMVTTYKDIELIVSCIKQGASEYCLKQMNLDEIIQRVIETIEKNIIIKALA